MPTGFHIASAWVDVRAEDKGLRQQVRGIVQKAAQGQDIEIPVRIDSKGLRSELTRAVHAATAGQGIKIPVKIDSGGLRRELNRAVRSATTGQQGVKVPLKIDSRGFRNELTRAIRAATVGQSIKIPIRATSVGLRAEVSRAARLAGAGQRIVIPVRADTSQLRTVATRDIRRFGTTGTTALRGLQWGAQNATRSVTRIGTRGFRGVMSSMPGMVAVVLGGLQAIGAGANIAAAILGAALPIAFIGIGAVALRNSKKVKGAFKSMGHTVSNSLRRAAKPLEGALVKGMRLVGREVKKMEGQLKQAFKATAPLVKPLVKGITGLVRNALPGFTRALQRSGPLMKGFEIALKKIGLGLGQMFDEMTKDGGAAAIGRVWKVIGEGIRMVLKELGVMFRTLAKDKDVVDTLKLGFQFLVLAIRLVTWAIKGLANATAFIRNPIKGVVDLIHDLWNLGKKLATSPITIKLVDWVSKKARQAWKLLKRFLGWVGTSTIKLKDWVSKKARQAWRLLKRFLGWVGTSTIKLKDWISKKAKQAWRLLKRFLGWVGTSTIKLRDWISKKARGAWKLLHRFLGWVGTSTIKVRDWVSRKARGAWRLLRKIAGFVARASIRAVDHASRICKRVIGFLGRIVSKTITITVDLVKKGAGAIANLLGFADGGLVSFASGGSIRGSGTGTSDSILAAVSNGEYVMRAAAVEKYGVDFFDAINSAKMPEFAVGGAVGKPAGSPSGGGGAGAGAVSGAAGAPAKPVVTQTQGGGATATLTATDKTGPALMSAAMRFNKFKTIVATTYAGINRSANLFGMKQKLATKQMMLGQTLSWTQGMAKITMASKLAQMGITRSSTLFGLKQKMSTTQMMRSQKLAWTKGMTGIKQTSALAYNGVTKATQTFGKKTTGRFTSTANGIKKTWNGWKNGLQNRTSSAYANTQKATKNWGKGVENRFQGTRNHTHKTWSGWENGLQHRTNAAYSSINKATKRWGGQMVDRFQGTRNHVGKAWNGVRPKLAAPIKYLINKVVNKGVIPAMNSVVKQLGGSAKLKRVSAGGFATGGYVSGAGSGTSDSIPARLSDGEYVIKAKSVQRYGLSTMNAINSGRAPAQEPLRRASGGPVSAGNALGMAAGGLATVTGAGKSKLEKMVGDYEHKDFENLADWIWENAVIPLLDKAPGGSAMRSVIKSGSKLMHQQAPAWLESNIPQPFGGAHVQRAKKWAKSQAGKPYQWGGAGNPSWDCSGFMSGIQKVIQGKNPKGRLWSTFAFRGNQAPAGWKRHLKSPFEVGITNKGKGHTAGTIAGMNVESAGGVGVRVGKKARGAHNGMFGNNWYGFKPALGGGLSGYKPGKGVRQWTGAVHQALREAHRSLSNTNRVLMQMKSESGGNPRAVNRTDINWRRGHPSVGLMQVIRPTFRRYAGKFRGRKPKMYGVSINPLANIYSAIKYVIARYGSIRSGMRGHAYAQGGPVRGLGSGRSDSIPARLSNGEYVMKSSAVAKYGQGFMDSVNKGTINGFANGGMVRDSSGKLVSTDYIDKVGDGIHTVKSGDTLSELALKWGSSLEELVEWNHISNEDLIYVGEQLRVLNRGTFDYQIKSGDTLSEIALRFGTTVSELMKLNKQIKDKDLIYAGRTIKIPGSGGSSGGGTPAPTYNPPYSFEPLRKMKDKEIEDKEALADLKGFVTLSEFTKKLPDSMGHITEFMQAFTEADSVDALFTTFWDVRKKLDDAVKGDIRKTLIGRMDLAGDALLDWQAQLDANTASMTEAQTAFDTVSQSFESLKQSVSESVESFGSITAVAQFGVSPQTILNKLQTDVSKSTAFAGQLEALKAAGVAGTFIQQIASAGLSGGGANMARSLLSATPQQIAELNRLQETLVEVGGRTGTAAADAMYGAGVSAAQGVIDGLTSKKDEIAEAMKTIATAMEKSIKEALGIKSPSRVMMEIARFVPLGFAEGIKGDSDAVVKAIAEMCGLSGGSTMASTPPAVGSGPATSNSGIMRAGSGGGVVIHELNVCVEANMDISKPQAAREFARKLGPAIKEELRRYDKERR